MREQLAWPGRVGEGGGGAVGAALGGGAVGCGGVLGVSSPPQAARNEMRTRAGRAAAVRERSFIRDLRGTLWPPLRGWGNQ